MDKVKTELLVVITIVDLSSYIVHGLVLDQLWQWFIEPFGIQPIGLPHAIGIVVIASFLTNQYNKDVEENMMKAITHNFGTPIMALLAGYIAHLFI